MGIFKTKEEKEKEQLEKARKKEEERLAKEEKEYKENLLNAYYAVVKTLFMNGTLYVVQDFFVGSLDDYYDLTSYKLELVTPIYDGVGRITRNGMMFNSEYVLFVRYSVSEKVTQNIEKKNALLHVFNGNSGGYAYIENDEKKIYEKRMSEMTDKNGKGIVEVYASLLDPNATNNLINQAQDELIQQAQDEQAKAIASGIASSLAVGMLAGSAAKLGKTVRDFGR